MTFDFSLFFSDLWESCVLHKEWILGVIALFFIFCVIRRHRLNALPIKTFSNELGEFFVTKSAILKLIESVGLENESIHIKKIKLANKKNLFCVKVYVVLTTQQSFETLSLQLQERMQQAIVKYCGVVKHVRVDIILDGLIKHKHQVEE